jgi:hypothetical protein
LRPAQRQRSDHTDRRTITYGASFAARISEPLKMSMTVALLQQLMQIASGPCIFNLVVMVTPARFLY